MTPSEGALQNCEVGFHIGKPSGPNLILTGKAQNYPAKQLYEIWPRIPLKQNVQFIILLGG